MKTTSRLMKETTRAFTFMMMLFLTSSCREPISAQPMPDNPSVTKKNIKIALLLDTSNSMDGLIDQAKSQLWSIVNELAVAKCDKAKPNLQIALYEYGNDGLSSAEGHIRQVTGFTNDLDLLSEKLFSLRTNGGNEFCGQVINTSLNQLAWNADGNDLQMIFIAGNEPFTQGSISYRESCKKAKLKGVVVNTIFCGDFSGGVSSNWKDGADITNGNYMSIEQNTRTVYHKSPYDKQITALNQKLNKTYIAYGSIGKAKKQNQKTQDNNAQSYGEVNQVKRAVSKSSHVYNNKAWDIVDASEEESFDVEKIKVSELPQEMKTMNKEEKEKYIKENKTERKLIQKQILELNKKREDFILKKQKATKAENSLDQAMIKAIKKQAKAKNFVFE